MYTKVFRSIYDGTLADNWQAMVTFQQLLILANDEGVVDMTINAIHRTTGIPVDILTAGIAVLEAPDHGSRTPDMEGRRISRLEDHRDWGWFLVNFKKYRNLVSRAEKREADRTRISTQRDTSGKDSKHVYFAVSGDLVKIGCSANPWARVKEFRTSNPNVKLALVIPGGFDLEKSLHEQFKSLHHDGEWFRFVGELRSFVVDRSKSSSHYVADVAHTDSDTEVEAEEAQEQSSLRSDSSSPSADDPPAESAERKLTLTAPVDLADAKAERLRVVTDDAIAAYNARLGQPNGLLRSVHAKVGRDKRRDQVKRCTKLARQICEQQFGSPTITREFWDAYFVEIDKDPWKRGDGPYTGKHENWRPGFEYLTRSEVMLEVFEKAISTEAAA